MKRLFGLLTFILIGLINFGYCIDVPTINTVDNYDGYYSYNRELVSLSSSQGNPTIVNISSDYDFVCVRHTDNTVVYFSFDRNTWNGVGVNAFTCIPAGQTIYMYGTSSAWFYFYKQGVGVVPGVLTENECKTIYNLMSVSDYTSSNCENDFGLIPLSSVNQNYCVNNGLCPSSPDVECPGSGDNWSALYINNIQHLGKPIINVTIPDYIFWDYQTNDNVFNLYVGSGYDQDYIDSVISINSYRPDTSDFTDIFVGGLTLIMPYIVILLFIVFIRKFIKRIFK